MRLALLILLPLFPLAVSSGAGIELTGAAVAANGTCAVTPVHNTAYPGFGKAGTPPIPWIAATPHSSHIIGFLFYNPVGVTGEAAFPHINGNGPSKGSSDKILWYVTAGIGKPGLKISGENLSAPDTMRSIVPEVSPANDYPSILNVRSAGCWRLTIRNGKAKGRVTLDVLP